MSIAEHISGRATNHDKIEVLEEHAHGIQLVYPTLAVGVTLTTAAAAWTLGTIVEIVPANTITTDFDIHEIFLEAINQSDKIYELHLFCGADDELICKTRFQSSTTRGIPLGNIQTPIVKANSRIRGQLAVEDGGSKTATISVRYHVY